MKSNWKHWLSAAILGTLLAATGVAAQNPDSSTPPPPPAGEKGIQERHAHMEEMAKALGLTDAQKDQMKQIHQDEKAKLDALRADTSLTQDQRRAQFKSIRQETHQKMTSLLTPEQQEKMKKFHAEHKGKMGGPGGHRHGPPPDGGPGPSDKN